MTPAGNRGVRVALLSALALLCIAGLAAAGKRLQTRSDTEQVAVDQRGVVKAKCRQGTKVVSGGFAAEFSDPPVNFPFIELDTSRRSGERTWRTSGFNDGNAAGELTSFAYCRDQGIVSVRDTVSAPVGDFVTATAKCPRGTKVISGGLEGSPIDLVGTTPVLYISESRRAGKRTWEGSAHSNGNEPGHLTAVANCGKAPKPGTRIASTTLSDTAPNTPFDSVVARCGGNQRAVSGGFGSPDDSGEATPRFMTSKKVGRRGWKVAAFYGSIGAPIEITAYAYCERR
jgi:hypothetical protein